jgi:isopenicillin-N epimerase
MMTTIGVDRVFAANHELAWRAGAYLADRWGTTIDTPESMVGAKITVPLPAPLGSTTDEAGHLRDGLLFEDHIEIQVHAWAGRLWTRVSAQIYNDMADMEMLAAAVERHLP